jgi:hypothetical protein
MRILHPPDLAGFQGFQRDSTFLMHKYPTVRVSEPNKEGNANRCKSNGRANASIDSAQQPAHARRMGTLYYGDTGSLYRHCDPDRLALS